MKKYENFVVYGEKMAKCITLSMKKVEKCKVDGKNVATKVEKMSINAEEYRKILNEAKKCQNSEYYRAKYTSIGFIPLVIVAKIDGKEIEYEFAVEK